MKAEKKNLNTLMACAGLMGLLLLGVVHLGPAWADSNISTTDKYAWSENTGWNNFHPSSSDGVVVGPKIFTGYVWQENIGWINMGSGNPDPGTGYYLNTTGDNWGVNHDGSTGALWGYAWGENVGWINFGTNPHDSNWGVSIATGDLPRQFSGWGWGENIGWINFNRGGDYPVTNSVAQAEGFPAYYYQSRAGGNWSATATWQQSSNGSDWEDAASTPDETSLGTTIQNAHTVTVDAGVTTDQTTVASGGALVVNNGITLTLANGDGTDLTVEGNLTNSGTLTCADGSEVIFSGASASTFTSSGATTFKTLTLNKDAADTALNITGTADMTVSTALTVTRGTMSLSGWTHNLLLGGSLSIGTDGRWVKHGDNAYYVQFTGDACTVSDASSPRQNLGHFKVD